MPKIPPSSRSGASPFERPVNAPGVETPPLFERAAHFGAANHASLRDLPGTGFWEAVKSLPEQAVRSMVTSRLTAGLVAATPAIASATTYNVTSASDTVDSDGGTVPGTLRDAIAQANANPGADTITFDASLNGHTITLTQGQLTIDGSLTIQGPGSGLLTIDGAGNADAGTGSRIFYLYASASQGDGGAGPANAVTISGLTLQDGYSTSPGGAVESRGADLTLSDVVIKDSVSTDHGGGLDVDGTAGGSLTMHNSSVSGNTGSYGGGVYVERQVGAVSVDHITVTDNTASSGTGGFYVGNSGAVTIQSSTFANNIAAGIAGGVQIYKCSDTVVETSTINGNTAGASGGGLWIDKVTSARVENCTITGNTATKVDSDGGVVAETGGGVYLSSVTGAAAIAESTIAGNTSSGAGGGLYANTNLTLVNSIIAGNTGAPLGDVATHSGVALNASYNIIQDPGGALFVDSDGGVGDAGMILGIGNITGMDPSLGTLADNGGPTKTMLPLTGSPAINAGDPGFVSGASLDDAGTTAPTTDQRGLTRVVGARIDIGAVEVQPPVMDAGMHSDGGASTDGGSTADGGSAAPKGKGCACNGTQAEAALALLTPIGLLLMRRRRRVSEG